MKTELLRLLKENEGYISGQELCEKFGVSRTAVWKVIKQLEAEGYEIEAVRNKGYHLKMAGDVMTQHELESSINTKWAGRTVLYFDETDSTNNELKKAADAGKPHGTLAVADYQSAGKGRRGRSWVSPHGVGIWMSILLNPDIDPANASMLTLVAALAVAEGIHKVCNIDTKIKWPNDIVANGKKICGILTEMSTEADWIHYVITGIGINVNTSEFPEDIQSVATSLMIETGARVRRSPLIAAIMESYEKYYEKFIENGNMSGLMDEYNSMLANLNNKVRVLAYEDEHNGVALGINEMGELIVRREDNGEIENVFSGEVSVRGIYGYV